MKDIFDTNARSSDALYGGQSSNQALGLGLPNTAQQLPGSFAPGGSTATSQSILQGMRARNAALFEGLNTRQTAPREPIVGYNPQTNTVFSGGKTFALDLNEGRANAQLLDVDNPELPPGFEPVEASQIRQRLVSEYENLGMGDSVQRRFGQAISNMGSTLQDMGATGVGTSMQEYGGGLAARNPSKITSARDLLESPWTAAKEGAAEAALYDLPAALVQTAAGAAVGAKVGAVFAPVTGGLSIPLGALLGGAGGRFLGTLFETYGSVRSEQREAGLDERGRALVAGSGSAALEALLGPEAKLASSMITSAGRKVLAQQMGQRGVGEAIGMAERGLARTAGREVLKQGAIEGATEFPQTILERWGARQDLTSPEAMDEYAIGTFKGAAGGGAIGSVAAVPSYLSAKEFVDDLKAKMAAAQDPALSGPDRLAAARYVQDVLKGESSNPDVNARLQKFRDDLAAADAAIAAQEAEAAQAQRDATQAAAKAQLTQETNEALAAGQAVDLLDPRRGVLQRDRSAEQDANLAQWQAQQEQGAAPELSSILAAGQAGQQWQDLQAQREQALASIAPVGQQAQQMFEEQRRTLLSSGEAAERAGEAAQPIVSALQSQADQVAPVQQAGEQFQDVMSGNLVTAMDDPQTFGPYLDWQNAAMGAEPGVASRVDPQMTTGPVDPIREAAARRLASTWTPRDMGESVSLDQRPTDLDLEVESDVSSLTEGERTLPRSQPEAGDSSSEARASDELFSGPRTVAEARAEDKALLDLIEKVSNEDMPPLRAQTTTQETPKVPGRPSMPEQVYAAVRNMVLNPKAKPVVRKKGLSAADAKLSAQYAEQVTSFANALNALRKAYARYTNMGGNLVRSKEYINRDKDENDKADKRVDAMRQAAADVQAALSQLGDAVNGNAKDVEVVIRLIKDRVHKGQHRPGDEKIDTVLSQAWAAAKRESYRFSPDLMDVRSGQIRPSKEEMAKGAANPLTNAAEGYAVHGKGAKATGIQGVLNYLRSHGTPWERTLANAINKALGDNPPKLVFDDKGPRYDPKTDTVYLSEKATPEVALHEALHGALQWFVYSNPNDSDVVALKAAVRAVVDYDSNRIGAKAVEVQKVLRKILAGKSKTAELDAVLELVSYGNTLGDFRKALQAMPAKVTPRSFVERATDVWRMLLAVTRKMLGVSDTMANEVIEATISLLEKATTAERTAPSQGNVLRADVNSLHTALEGDVAASPFQAPFTRAQMVQFNKKLVPSMPTEYLFQAYGGWWNKLMKVGKDKLAPVHEAINEHSPRLSRWLRWINSHYGLQSGTVDALVKAKDDQRGGTAVFSALGHYFTTLPPEQSIASLTYIDERVEYLRGNRAAPEFPAAAFTAEKMGGKKVEANVIRGLADTTADMWWKFANDVRDQKVRDALVGVRTMQNGKVTHRNGTRFSQALAHVKSVKDLASRSFGARNLSSLIARRAKTEVNGDAIIFDKDDQGTPDLNDQFIGLYELTPDLDRRMQRGESLDDIDPHAFISAKLYFANGVPTDRNYRADPTYMWDLREHGEGGFRLTAKLDAVQAIRAGKAINLSHALQNTMEIMARSYSANRLADSMVDLGRVDGDPTPESVVYDSLDQLNATINGTYAEDGAFTPELDQNKWTKLVKEKSIVDISDEESKASIIKDAYRSRSRWVRLPGSDTYGAMAGKIVSGDVWSAIEDMSDRQPLVNAQFYNNTIRRFKKAKTIYNPMTWGTNVATNVTMTFMDDIPMATLAQAARLYTLYQVSPGRLTKAEQDLMLEIMKTNALLGNFTSTEVRQALYESMQSAIDEGQTKLSDKVMQFFKLEHSRQEFARKWAGKGKDGALEVDRRMEEWYAGQDNIFRVASMLNYLGQKAREGDLTPEHYRLAGDHARFAFLDYDIDSKAVRIMRQTAIPFVSWPYAMAKLLGHVAVHKPWKIVNMFLSMYLIEGILQAMAGDDDEEDAAKRKAGPEWARQRLLGLSWMPHTHLRVPFVGDDKNPVYYDLGRYIPVHSYSDSIPNSFMGVDGWPSFITPSSPFIGGTIALVVGVDPFTGNKLAPPTATSWENILARGKFIASQFTPSIPLVNPVEFDKAKEVIRGRTDRTDNHAALYMARQFGMRFYDYNVDSSLQTQSRAVAAIMREYRSEIGRLRRAEARYENPDWDRFIEKQNQLYERMRKEIERATGDE